MADFLTNHKPFHIITLFTSYQECRWLKPRGNYSKWRLVLLPRRGSRKVNRGFSCWPSWDMSLMFLIHLKIPIFIETFLHFLGVCMNNRNFSCILPVQFFSPLESDFGVVGILQLLHNLWEKPVINYGLGNFAVFKGLGFYSVIFHRVYQKSLAPHLTK